MDGISLEGDIQVPGGSLDDGEFCTLDEPVKDTVVCAALIIVIYILYIVLR